METFPINMLCLIRRHRHKGSSLARVWILNIDPVLRRDKTGRRILIPGVVLTICRTELHQDSLNSSA